MGFEDLEGNVDTGKGSEEDGKEAQEAQAEDSALPEPDEERRQIAESQEVRRLSLSSFSVGPSGQSCSCAPDGDEPG